MAKAEPHRCDLCSGTESEILLTKNGASYRECQSCGFIFTDQGLTASTDANMDYFDATLEKYVAKAFSEAKQRAYSRKLKMFEGFRQLGTIAEIGSNVGGFLYRAQEEGWRATGVEPVPACATYARERKGLDVKEGVLESVGLEENSFDAVFSNAVFEHLPAPSVVFEEVKRVLRPGGVAFIDTVNWDSYTRRNIGAQWKLLDPLVHLCIYTPKTLARYCEQAGLEVVKISTHGVRFRPNHAPRLSGFARFAEELKKLPFSILSRFTLKGDSIAVFARKPG